MINKWIKGVMAFMLMVELMFGSSATVAAKSYSGGHSFSGGSYSSHSTRSYSGSSSSGNTYHSGYKSPSSNVSGSSYNSSYSRPRSTGGLGHFFGGFATGMVASSLFHGLFHPFGGYYGGGYHSFSIFGFLIDLFVLWILYRIVRRMFFRR